MRYKLVSGVDFVNNREHSQMKKSILISVPVLFIIGGFMHFLFDLTGKVPIIGAFVPVNESPWEHLKMAFYPMLVWWIAYCFSARKYENFSMGKLIISAAAALVSSPLIIIMFFYSYTGAFGVESLFLDIFSLFLAIAAGQCLGFHIYKYGNPKHYWLAVYISFAIIMALVIIFILFTFLPPHIPIFMDSNTGGFGINQISIHIDYCNDYIR